MPDIVETFSSLFSCEIRIADCRLPTLAATRSAVDAVRTRVKLDTWLHGTGQFLEAD
jgi:hypothetical protein